MNATKLREKKLTKDILKKHLMYCSDTGDFFRVASINNCGKTGNKAGYTCKINGYHKISVLNTPYAAHRLAWLYVTGNWPKEWIDHINGVRNDNRFCNLRECTSAQNSMNQGMKNTNTSGYKGVSWDKNVNKWQAQIRVNYKYVYLGKFVDIEEAAQAYIDASDKYHKEFGRIV